MSAIIDRILEIEDKAQKIVDDAVEEKNKISSQVPLEIEKIQNKTQQRFKKELDSKKEKWQKEIDKEISAIKTKTAANLAAMEKESKEKMKHWENIVLNNIIGLDGG